MKFVIGFNDLCNIGLVWGIVMEKFLKRKEKEKNYRVNLFYFVIYSLFFIKFIYIIWYYWGVWLNNDIVLCNIVIGW